MTRSSERNTPARRPIKARETGFARRLTGWLAGTRITPNQISAIGLAFGLVAGLLFGVSPTDTGLQPLLVLGAAVCIGLRLLCNMLDGMVAVEGGKAGPTGPLWNEVPDRLADIAVLVGTGVASGLPELGWAAAALAILTAYIRVLGEQLCGQADFGGPMAKPHRMAVLIAAAIGASVAGEFGPALIQICLIVVVGGAAITVVLRCRRAHLRLARSSGS